MLNTHTFWPSNYSSKNTYTYVQRYNYWDVHCCIIAAKKKEKENLSIRNKSLCTHTSIGSAFLCFSNFILEFNRLQLREFLDYNGKSEEGEGKFTDSVQ